MRRRSVSLTAGLAVASGRSRPTTPTLAGRPVLSIPNPRDARREGGVTKPTFRVAHRKACAEPRRDPIEFIGDLVRDVEEAARGEVLAVDAVRSGGAAPKNLGRVRSSVCRPACLTGHTARVGAMDRSRICVTRPASSNLWSPFVDAKDEIESIHVGRPPHSPGSARGVHRRAAPHG
jgi:hypothetical protein